PTFDEHLTQVILCRPGIGQSRLECLDSLGQRGYVLTDRRQDVARDVQRPAFLLDLIQRNDLGAILNILECAVPGDNLVTVLMIEKILRPAFAKQAGRVDDKDLVLTDYGLLAA